MRMITNPDIVEIFRIHLPANKRIAVEQIHKLVENNWKLTEEDWLPHPSEINRGSNYPGWKRKVQAALHNLKRRGKIKHFATVREYEFDLASFD